MVNPPRIVLAVGLLLIASSVVGGVLGSYYVEQSCYQKPSTINGTPIVDRCMNAGDGPAALAAGGAFIGFIVAVVGWSYLDETK